MSDIKFACIHCGKHLKAPATMVNRRVACSKCGKQITVPAASDAPPAPAVPVASRASTAAAPVPPAAPAPPSAPAAAAIRTPPSVASAAASPDASAIAAPYPWDTPPQLLEKAASYRQRGEVQSFPCKVEEFLEGLLRWQVFSSLKEKAKQAANLAELHVYPDLVGIVQRPEELGCLASLLMRVLPLQLALLIVSLLSNLIGLAILGVIAIVILSVPFVVFNSYLLGIACWFVIAAVVIGGNQLVEYLAQKNRDRIAARVRAKPRSSYAVKQMFKRAGWSRWRTGIGRGQTGAVMAERYWAKGDVVQLVRMDAHRRLVKRCLLLVVMDHPLPADPGLARIGAVLLFRRAFRPRRRIYVIDVEGGAASADAAGQAVSRVLGIPVQQGRFGLLAIRVEGQTMPVPMAPAASSPLPAVSTSPPAHVDTAGSPTRPHAPAVGGVPPPLPEGREPVVPVSTPPPVTPVPVRSRRVAIPIALGTLMLVGILFAAVFTQFLPGPSGTGSGDNLVIQQEDFPWQTGMKEEWQWAGSQPGVCECTLLESAPSQRGLLFHQRSRYPGGSEADTWLLLSSAGIEAYDSREITTQPPVFHWPLPLRSGQIYQYTTQAGQVAAHVEGPVEIRVPAGTYQSLMLVEQVSLSQGGSVENRFWFAPNVGCVKWLLGMGGPETFAASLIRQSGAAVVMRDAGKAEETPPDREGPDPRQAIAQGAPKEVPISPAWQSYHGKASDMAIDPAHGCIWLIMDVRLCRFDLTTEKIEPAMSDADNQAVKPLRLALEGDHVWLGGFHTGLWMYDIPTKSTMAYTVENSKEGDRRGLQENYVSSIVAQQDEVWIYSNTILNPWGATRFRYRARDHAARWMTWNMENTRSAPNVPDGLFTNWITGVVPAGTNKYWIFPHGDTGNYVYYLLDATTSRVTTHRLLPAKPWGSWPESSYVTASTPRGDSGKICEGGTNRGTALLAMTRDAIWFAGGLAGEKKWADAVGEFGGLICHNPSAKTYVLFSQASTESRRGAADGIVGSFEKMCFDEGLIWMGCTASPSICRYSEKTREVTCYLGGQSEGLAGFSTVAGIGATADWVFVATDGGLLRYRKSGQDPRVVSTSPASGSQSVAVGQKLVAVFDLLMNAKTIHGRSVEVLVNGALVAGKVSYDPARNAAVFALEKGLPGGMECEFVLKSLIQAANGNPIRWTSVPFTTK